MRIKLISWGIFLFIIAFYALEALEPKVRIGAEELLQQGLDYFQLKGKKVGLITNHTAISSRFKTTFEIFRQHPEINLMAVFTPEHGLDGVSYAGENIKNSNASGLNVYSLHGNQRRPNAEMLKNIEVLVYDMQDIGSRSYTYISTLFYCMEEAAKYHIKMVVLDRPNPLSGLLIDGPMLEDKWRSFVGYVNVPYCHGMTIGELAQYFNEEYKIRCELVVVPMKGWKRWMAYKDTGLPWIPTSPNIPEEDTPFYYPTTGLIGELSIVNIGIGYTLPFKVIGAPWINADKLAVKLNSQNLPGVHFRAFHYRPFFGKFSGEDCHGVLIKITEPKHFLPVTTQFTLMGILKGLYPKEFSNGLAESQSKVEMFNKVNGQDSVYKLLTENGFVTWKLRELCQKDQSLFLNKRKKYLLPEYDL